MILLVFCGALLAAEDKPTTQQPIPFSHKTHTAGGVKCLDCHSLRKPGFAAGIPGEQVCMGCHTSVKADSPAIQKLAAYASAKKPVPWVRLYRIPDYVWFSHAVHNKEADLGCDVCHGPVAEREVLSKEKGTSMASCMECHASRKAPNACNVCHDTR